MTFTYVLNDITKKRLGPDAKTCHDTEYFAQIDFLKVISLRHTIVIQVTKSAVIVFRNRFRHILSDAFYGIIMFVYLPFQNPVVHSYTCICLTSFVVRRRAMSFSAIRGGWCYVTALCV